MKLATIASLIGAELSRDGEVVRLASLSSATPSDLSFILPNRTLDTRAGALILEQGSYPEFDGIRLEVSDVYAGYAKASRLFARSSARSQIHPSAVLENDVLIGENVTIGAQAYIGSGVRLGDNTVIGAGCVVGEQAQIGTDTELRPRVVIENDVQVGAGCLIHAGAVIGAEGFGFAPSPGGWIKIHQLGCVVIGDDCEIGANTCIDRGALDNTIIGDGVKIDNQVMIAHNCTIGDRTAIAACVGMAGSTHIGADCTVGGAAGFTGHIQICDKVHIGAMTLVAGNILRPGAYAGGVQGARPMGSWKKNVARFNQLDELAKRLIRLEKLIAKS